MALFIGGPWDGKTYYPHGTGNPPPTWNVIKKTGDPLAYVSPENRPIEPDKIVTYTKFELSTPCANFFFYIAPDHFDVPHSEPEFITCLLQQLINAYQANPTQ